MIFDKNQIDFMSKIGILINFSDNLSDYEIIEEKVSNYLQVKGFDSNYEPIEEGKMCESILDRDRFKFCVNVKN